MKRTNVINAPTKKPVKRYEALSVNVTERKLSVSSSPSASSLSVRGESKPNRCFGGRNTEVASTGKPSCKEGAGDDVGDDDANDEVSED